MKILELTSGNFLYHGSMSNDVVLFHGAHLGTEDQAKQRIQDRTEFRQAVNKFIFKIKEKVKRSLEETIEIEDDGSPGLSHALTKASQLGKISENSARIARKKSDKTKAELLMKYGIYRIIYENKYEGQGVSHIVVNPSDYEIVDIIKF